MPKKNISVAEKAGISFETRCKEALELLRQLWMPFQGISTEYLLFKEERAQRREALLASLAKLSPKRRAKLLAEFHLRDNEVEKKFKKVGWKKKVQSVRKIWGDDATDAALKVFEPERTSN